MNCGSCGSTNPIGASFCSNCRVPFESNISRYAIEAAHPAPYGLPRTSVGSPTPKVKRKLPSWKRVAVVSAISVGIGLGIVELIHLQWNQSASDTQKSVQSQAPAEDTIKRGLLITAIRPSSPAEACGLRPRDIIIRYGGSAVEDITGYIASTEARSLDQSVTLTVFREGKEIDLNAPTGALGFMSEDWNSARKEIYDRLSIGDSKGAAELAADAERDRSLTQVQALIVKIMLIPNRSSKQKEQERAELLTKLTSLYPTSHVCQLATSEFLHLRSYAAAARCYEYRLARFDNEDVSARLNLAYCYVRLFEFDKAEQTVHYILDRPDPGLSPHGFLVAQQALGGVALGRNRYREALTHFLPYLEKGDDYTMLMSLLAAAKLGDLEKFNEILDRATAVSADSVKRLRFDVDTLNAYALSEKGRRDEAAELVLKWGTPQCIVDTAASYWDTIPGGGGIADRMRSLVKIS